MPPPGSLPDPSSLWSAWSRLSGALGVLGVKDVWWTTDDGHAHHDDHGGSRSTLAVLDGDRGVLHGWDRDATFDRHDVTRAAPPVDLFAGAPSWLPFDELREASDSDQLGWLFWYQPGSGWARAPYPDGLTDGSTRLLLPVTTDAGFEGVVQEWARDDDELARAQTAARTAPAPPTSLARSTGARPGRPLMSVQEQDTLAEAAARDSRELPRPAPAPSPVLERVVATVRAAVPRGRFGSITAWLGEGTATVFDDGAVTAHELDLVGPLRELQHTEASETGRWSFVTVVVDGGDVRVARAYDTVPSWWEREDYDYPSLPPLAELRARPATWQPDWMDLLEGRTRTAGVPPRYADLARRVLGRDIKIR